MSAITTRELVEIDERRLLRRLDDLAQRGALPTGGIYRPLYSPAWTSAMDLVTTWMKEAGTLASRARCSMTRASCGLVRNPTCSGTRAARQRTRSSVQPWASTAPGR